MSEQQLAIEESQHGLVVGGEGYRLVISRDLPEIDLSVNGRHLARLNVGSGLDTVEAFDEATTVEPPAWRRERDGLLVTWHGRSTIWSSKRYELLAWPGGFSYGYEVEGAGAIDRAHLFRTRRAASPAGDLRIFNPEPTSGAVQYTGQRCPENAGKLCYICLPNSAGGEARFTGSADFTTITVGRDKPFHDGNWFFTPAPWCLAFEGNGNWLVAGIAARPGEWSFGELDYPGGGFGLSMVYKGHVEANGTWRSPRLLCLTASGEYEGVAQYCARLRHEGYVPDHGRGPTRDWWRQPIFCGWGEQISQEVHHGPPLAPHRAVQSSYVVWLRTLDRHGVDPGTIVVDDKWQGSYGLNDVDTVKWPDMPGFIAEQHERGRRVLLWLKAWDPEGVPAEECIVDAEGKAVAVDPTNLAFRARFEEQVRYMLQEIGADGFKVDFTHLIPRGANALHAETMRRRNEQAGYADVWPDLWPAVRSPRGGKWGLELMRSWLEILSDTARRVKPDAMVMTHTGNPYLANLVDVLRLNDVHGLPDRRASIRPGMLHRARVARAASPFWLVDADNWPCASREQWRDYVLAQGTGEFGVPSLYHAERFGWGSVDEPLDDEDYAAIRSAWSAYRSRLNDQEIG